MPEVAVRQDYANLKIIVVNDHSSDETPWISILTLVIHYFALLSTRPGNKFNGLVALAFPLMCVPFAASCLRATYMLAAKGRFEWRGRETDMRAQPIETGEPSHTLEPLAGPDSAGESSPSTQ